MSSKFASPFMAKSPLRNERVAHHGEKKGKKNKVKNTLILNEADADSSKQDSDKVVIHKETWKDDPNKRKRDDGSSGRTVKIKRKVVSKKRGERAKKRLKKKNERNKEQR
jgi:hypothetical protein